MKDLKIKPKTEATKGRIAHLDGILQTFKAVVEQDMNGAYKMDADGAYTVRSFNDNTMFVEMAIDDHGFKVVGR